MSVSKRSLGILDGYSVSRGSLGDYQIKTRFEPLLEAGVKVNLLVPDVKGVNVL